MNNAFFNAYALSIGAYGNEIEYANLSKEEKEYLDFMDRCLYSENVRINDASFHMMLFLIELSSNVDAYTYEQVKKRKEEIYKYLTFEERDVLEKFTYACINSMGIYSEEAKNERKLKMRKDDK